MTPPTGTPRMTDDLSNAEPLLRAAELMRVAADRVELPKMPEDTTRYDDADCDGFCLADDLRAAADALAAERERRGELVLANYPCSRCANKALPGSSFCPDHHREYGALNAALAIAAPLGEMERELVALRAAITKTTAPPLPPATGEGVEAECASCGNRNDQHRADGECPEYGYFVPAARPTPEPSKCDCGDPSAASCASCIVADYQAQHPNCATCCPRPYRAARPTPEPSKAIAEANKALHWFQVNCDYPHDAEIKARADAIRAALAAQEGT